MASASMLVHVTHIDDSIQGLQGPCVHFWGMTNDRSLSLTMELFLESIRLNLETKLPPLNLSVLENVPFCCVLINHRWQRAQIPELKLSDAGTIEVFCIDSGETHSVPLALVRTLDFSGYEANNIKECPPLASKFILADVVAPCGPASHTRQWSKFAMMFLKINVENHTWKAVPLGKYDTYQAVRLFDSNDQLFASIMIQQALGVAAKTYHEALSMCEVMNKQPAYMKPAFYSSPTMKLFPAGCNITALSKPVRPAFAIPITQQEHLLAPPVAYVINNLPVKGRHDVIVSHVSDGPFKFYVQMKSETSNLLKIREKLNMIAPQPFHGTPMGSPCMALSPTDKLFYRGLITGVKDYGNPGCVCTVYFVDIGTQYPINLSVICIIPDELLVPSLCAYPVSLFGLQEVANLCGLKEIFAAFVNSASNFQVEVVNAAKQEVNLYDETGRSIRDVLFSIFSNLKNTKNFPNAISDSMSSSVMHITVADMPSLNLVAEESLFVSFTEKPGYFFGQLEKIRLPDSKTVLGIKCLTDMADELSKAYTSEPSPPLLYVDTESRLGYHGVVLWDVDQVYYRVRVTKELANVAEVEFIDFGNSICLPRDKILAPLGNLTSLRQPSFGVHCQLNDNVNLSVSKWTHLIIDKWIKVKMGRCIEGVYTVTFTSDPCNSEIVKVLTASVSPKLEEDVGKTNQTIEIPRPVSTQLVAPQAAIVITDNRSIKTSDNGGYSITFANKQTVMETNGENAHARSNCSVTSGKGSNIKMANGVDNYKDPVLIECKASATGRPVEEVIQSERMELSCTLQTTSISKLQNSSSSDNETPKIPKELNEQLFIETVELQKSAVVPVTSITKVEPLGIQKQYTYPQQPMLTGLQKQIEVVFINDPSDFYVHLSESCATLEQLAKKLNLVYSDESKPAIQNAKTGSACVVQFEEDNLWYRGQIIKLYDSNSLVPLANVFFVDYGNTQRCPIKQIKAIDEEFVGLNPLAFKCTFDGIDVSHVWTAEETIQFEQCCIGKTLTAAFAKQDAEGKYPVCLVEKSEDGAVVISDMFGKPIPASVEPMVFTKLPISKTPIEVTITCCSDLDDFYLRPFDLTSYQDPLDELEKLYSALLPNELLEDQPSIGLPCVVRFSEDERYYRSEILSIQDEMAEVIFVDKGIKQHISVSQLKRIIPRFMAFPRLTWYCQLKEVKLNSPASEELQKHLRSSILSGDKVSALFDSASSEGEILQVELTLPTIGNLSQYLAQHEALERASLITEVEMVVQNVNFSPGEIISTRAITSFAKSPTEFWIQLEPESVEAIMTRIDKLAVDPEFLNKKNFTALVGKPCLAFFADDGRWYRAVIEALSEDSAVVCYVDYGNSCTVKTCDLRGLPPDLAETPASAYKCCQEGTECFLMNVAEMYIGVIVDETALTVKFVKVVDGVLCVRIFHPDGTDLGDLCSEQPAELPEVPVDKSTENVAPVVSNFIGEAISVNTMSSEVLGHAEESSEEPVIQEPLKTVEHVEGYVVFCISPVQFWFQTKEDEVKLNKIQAYLSEHYGENPDAFPIKGDPVVGQIYGINHPIYDGWYRGRVEKASDGAFEVNFVDYGDTQTVSLESIRDLLKEWADIPPLATRCSWTQSIEWSHAAAEKFNAVCLDSEKLCRVRYVAEENGVRFVDSLFVAESNVVDFLGA